jgi:aryl-alcohol dehydrogenase-like predicted oxidoreductase
LDLLERLGKERGGISTSQVALGWLLADPLVTSPIIGPRTLQQLDDNLGAIGLRLTEEEKKLLDEASSWKND